MARRSRKRMTRKRLAGGAAIAGIAAGSGLLTLRRRRNNGRASDSQPDHDKGSDADTP